MGVDQRRATCPAAVFLRSPDFRHLTSGILRVLLCAAPEADSGLKASTTNGKENAMRTLGYLFTPLAAFMWGLTVLACVVVYLIPQARDMPMPVYDRTVIDFFLDLSIPMAIALVVTNGLSGRWGPEYLRPLDLGATRLGLIALVLICLAVFVGNWGREGLTEYATLLLLGLTAFAFYDLLVNQGEDWRSSTLRGAQVLAERTAAAAARINLAAATAPAPALAVAPQAAPAPAAMTVIMPVRGGHPVLAAMGVIFLLIVFAGAALVVFGDGKMGLAARCGPTEKFVGNNSDGVPVYHLRFDC